MTERNEPILQVAKAVDVIDSREGTPVFEDGNEEDEEEEEEEEEERSSDDGGAIEPLPTGGQIWTELPARNQDVYAEQFSSELEDLSRASRKFLEVCIYTYM